MDRLTYKGERDWEIKGANGTPCDEVCEGRGLAGCGNCPIQNVFNRLAAYEDTGLESEEILSPVEMAGMACALQKLKKYEAFGTVEELIALNQLNTNPPLTLEELREMDGEPVWCVELNLSRPRGLWAIIAGVVTPEDLERRRVSDSEGPGVWLTYLDCQDYGMFNEYGKTWIAYRRKPEEGETWRQ